MIIVVVELRYVSTRQNVLNRIRWPFKLIIANICEIGFLELKLFEFEKILKIALIVIKSMYLFYISLFYDFS